MLRKRRHEELLADEDVKRWYESEARKSRATADLYLGMLGDFCHSHGISPKTVAIMGPRHLSNLFKEFFFHSDKEARASESAGPTIEAISSWMRFVHGWKEVGAAPDLEYVR
ncbi:MAG: hypothetical protein JTT11_07885 [Candidatus Brockarchaeota archaeon]|nr:hypothetical protein [Candidatus Brockarchaeota archaeon]